MLKRPVGLCLWVGALLLTSVAASTADAQEMKQAYLQMSAVSYEQFNSSIDRIEELGAIIRHRIYPYAAIGQIESGSEPLVGTVIGVRRLFVGEIEATQLTSFKGREAFLAKAYNNIFFSPVSPPRSTSLPADAEVTIDFGPRTIPQEYLDEIKEAARAAPSAPPPWPEATSEFLLGHVAVGCIMPESEPGVGGHNWSGYEEGKATEELISAMDWWARHSPNQELRFSYEINYAVPVSVEPMEDGQDAIEAEWAGQSLANLGYTTGSHFVQSYAYINDMRQRYDTDWGFVCFILHGFENQQFSSGALAYAYLGGPLNVNVYSNGYLGPGSLDRVIAHESGHTFYTLDEYSSAPFSCSSRSGYLSVENANKLQGGASCKSNIPCVMRGGSQATPFDILLPCYYTRGQVGWWDSDADGIPDILDTKPKVDEFSLGASVGGTGSDVDTVYSDRATFSGQVSSVPATNRNNRSMFTGIGFTVEPVSAEYRVDEGPWMPCQPADGRFDHKTERFTFTLSNLGPWREHIVEVRAVTAHGNTTPGEDVAALRVFSTQEPPILTIRTSNPTSTPVSISFTPYHSSREAGVSVNVEVGVFDALGRRLRTLESGEFATGTFYETIWDGTDSNGKTVPAGVYFVGMISQGRLTADKLLVIP